MKKRDQSHERRFREGNAARRAQRLHSVLTEQFNSQCRKTSGIVVDEHMVAAADGRQPLQAIRSLADKLKAALPPNCPQV
jgi:hypothetical protein